HLPANHPPHYPGASRPRIAGTWPELFIKVVAAGGLHIVRYKRDAFTRDMKKARTLNDPALRTGLCIV
ncbi:MAG: hypothetical protein WD038_02240, partial [Balneolales bacterium]